MLTMEILQSAARRLAASAARPARVILFGSYARGDADAASDVDLMVVESGDFGTVRMIVDDLAKARRVLMELHMPARVDDVLVLDVDGSPSSLARILKPLQLRRINVSYMYAFPHGSKKFMVFRFSDHELAAALLEELGFIAADLTA